jgi:hypothetical protein
MIFKDFEGFRSPDVTPSPSHILPGHECLKSIRRVRLDWCFTIIILLWITHGIIHDSNCKWQIKIKNP